MEENWPKEGVAGQDSAAGQGGGVGPQEPYNGPKKLYTGPQYQKTWCFHCQEFQDQHVAPERCSEPIKVMICFKCDELLRNRVFGLIAEHGWKPVFPREPGEEAESTQNP